MGRTTTIRALAAPLTTLATLAALTACSGTAEEPDTEPPPPSTRPASPSTSPSPTPPAMPAAARAHTRAGAEAFVRYFWQVVNYAETTGDTDAIARLSAQGCAGCDGGIAAIRRVRAAGGSVTGGGAVLGRMDTVMSLAGDLRMADVRVTLDFAPQRVDYPGSRRDKRTAASRTRDRLELVLDPQGWRVSQLEVVG